MVPTFLPDPIEMLAYIGIALYLIAAMLYVIPWGGEGKPECSECRAYRLKMAGKGPKRDG